MRVSVLMVTYNHEAYIAQAIESVLAQEHPDFDIELVVGEDCSTDATRDVVSQFVRDYPETVTLVTGEHNVGQQRNVARAWRRCTGDYIAVLDGDDYWTSPAKLRTQVAYMEAHPDCAMCFHNVAAVDDSGTHLETPEMSAMPERTRLEDLLIGNYIGSCSIMYRGGLVRDLPDWWNDVALGDFPLNVLHARFGWIGYIDEVMAAYRRHDAGRFSRQRPARQVRAFMTVLRNLDRTLERRYHAVIRRSLRRLRMSMAATWLFDVAPPLRPLLARLKTSARRLYRPAV